MVKFLKVLSRASALALSISSLLVVPSAQSAAPDTLINSFSFAPEIPTSTSISPDGTFAIVSSSTNIYRINLMTNTIVDTITVSNSGYRSAITPDGRYAYILNYNDGLVYKFDTSIDSITATISGITSPRGISMAPDGSYLIVVSNLVNTNYYKIDVATNALTTYTSVLPDTPYEVSISPDGTKALFATYNRNKAMLVNLTTHSLIRTYTNSYAGFSVWSSDSSAIYLCNQNGSMFYKIDPNSTSTATYSYSTGSCYSLALTPDNSSLLVAASSGNVYRFSTSNLSTVAGTTTGLGTLSWDIKVGTNSSEGVFALVADRTNKRISRIFVSEGISPATLTLTASFRTATKGTSTSLSASSNAAGKVTFYADGKKIAGCISRQTVFSATHDVICSWKPTVQKAYLLHAVIKPTGNTHTSGGSNSLTISVVRRSGTR